MFKKNKFLQNNEKNSPKKTRQTFHYIYSGLCPSSIRGLLSKSL